MKKGVDRITQPLYKGSSTRGAAPPNKETTMTNFAAFEVYCTEDKFWAMHDCFDDVRNPDTFKDFPEDSTPNAVKVKANNRSVTFSVDADDAFTMAWANFMVDCWNK